MVEPRPSLERLDPYVAACWARAERFALRLHADHLGVPHLFAALLEDEDCAATQVIVHAFADPETILAEVVAQCPGIMVVGSKRSRPFSVRGVAVLDEARRMAVARRHANVEIQHLFASAMEQIDDAIAGTLRDNGYEPSGLVWPDEADDPVPADGPVLARFSKAARRALSAAARTAQSYGRDAISPIHIVIGTLDDGSAIGGDVGLRASLVRQAASGRDGDDTPLPNRGLAPSEELVELVGALPDGAGTTAILLHLIRAGSDELRLLLDRQRVTESLLERAGTAFRDPEA